MRALVVSIWVFINLVFFGMCGYMYLLWSQYWMYTERQSEQPTYTYDQQIYFYNRGYNINETLKENHHNFTVPKNRTKHSTKENVTLIKNSKPRFSNLQTKQFETDTNRYTCNRNETKSDCNIKTANYKDTLMKELRRVFTDESNVFKSGLENTYDVHYRGPKGNYMNKTPTQILCQLKKVELETFRKFDENARSAPFRDYLPKRGFYENKRFNSCAIVASSGSLKDSNLGYMIDSHSLVLRFNHAPTKGFEKDVGNKTTVRILNSQVVTKDEFKFLTSDLYKNITLLVWDPSNYTATLQDWFDTPEFNFFPNYIQYRKRSLKSKFFILNPKSLWALWDFLQSNSPSRLRRNPPSSGFLGLGLLLPICDYVDFFEYIPSVRVTRRCHYYGPEVDPACTFGVWHPLAAEKLLTYHLNVADDRTVFQEGFVRIPGFRKLRC